MPQICAAADCTQSVRRADLLLLPLCCSRLHRLSGTPKPVLPAPAAGEAGAGNVSGDVSGTPLYVALPQDLACRLVYAAPLRSEAEMQLGSLHAPTG